MPPNSPPTPGPADDNSRRPHGFARGLGLTATVALVYWLSGKLALTLALPPGYATAVWPGAGIALALILVWGRRHIFGVVLGSFCVNIGTSFDSSSALAVVQSCAVALVIAGGAALQVALGEALVRRFVGLPVRLEDARDTTRFIVLAAPVACVVSPTVGALALVFSGAMSWDAFAFSWGTWWTGDTIGVLIFAPLTLSLLAEPRAFWRRRRVVLGVPLVVGFALTTALFVRASAWEQTRLDVQLERQAAPILYALKARLAAYTNLVSAVAGFVRSTRTLNPTSFRVFAAHLLARHAGILGLSFNPSVLDSERQAFERSVLDAFPTFRIRERNASGVLVPAARRAEHLPVLYMEPQAGNERARGYDLTSEPVRLDALRRARATGGPTATGPITLVQELGRFGFLLFVPISEGPNSARWRGLAVGAFHFDVMVTAALEGLDVRGLALRLEDTAAEPSGRVIYASPGASPAVDGRRWSRPLEFGGRTWRLDVALTPGSSAAQGSWQAWMVLAGGLLFVGMLGFAMLVTTGRAARAEADAARVAEAEKRYRDLYENAPEMYLSIAAGTARIVDCNQTAATALGYSKEELIGRPVFELYAPSSLDAARTVLSRFSETGEVTDSELAVRHKDGRTLDVSLSASAVRDERGRILHSRSVWRDITLRKQADRDRHFLLRLSDVVTQARDLGALFFEVATALGEHLGASRCLFNEVDANHVEATNHRDYHPGLASVAGPLALAAFGAAGRADLAAGRGAVNHNTREDPRTAALFEATYGPLGVGASVAVPLLREGLWRSTLWVSSTAPRTWSVREVALIHAVADKTWLRVEQLRLVSELRSVNEDLEARVANRTQALRGALQEKEILLKEVHHRVKNNLQVIASLLSLQARHLADPSAKAALLASQARVYSMALVHERLLESSDLAHVEFGPYVRGLVAEVLRAHNASARRISATIDVEGATLSVGRAVSYGLIINELVTNALKHAFPNGRPGAITIALQALSGNQLELRVADDGVGLPPGLDPSRTASVGLDLVYSLAQQLRAEVDVIRDSGTTFILRGDIEVGSA